MVGQSSDRIPVLRPDMPLHTNSKLQPEADETTRKLYQDVAPGVVKVETNKGRGTGFFVDQDGRVVTDAHVVQDSQDVEVRLGNGERYHARIEKLDDINDLAVLRLEGGKTPGGQNVLGLGTSDQLKPDQPIYALGNALGLDQVYISPGYFRDKETNRQFIQNLGDDETKDLKKALKRMTPLESKEALDVLNRPLIHGRVHIDHGNSGGPLVDAQGKVIGVSDLIEPEKKSLAYFTPVEKVRDLLNRKDPKFAFSYTHMGADWAEAYKRRWEKVPPLAALETGFAGFAGYTIASKLPRVTSGAMCYYGFSHLYSDYDHWRGSHDSKDSWKYGLSAVSDLAITAGGVAGLFAKTRTFGLLGMGVGLAAHLGTDFIPNRLVLTDIRRTAKNDYRPPENLDHILGDSMQFHTITDKLKRLGH